MKLFDYLEIVVQEHQKQQWFKKYHLNHFGRESSNNLNIDDSNEIEIASKKNFDTWPIVQISKSYFAQNCLIYN